MIRYFNLFLLLLLIWLAFGDLGVNSRLRLIFNDKFIEHVREEAFFSFLISGAVLRILWFFLTIAILVMFNDGAWEDWGLSLPHTSLFLLIDLAVLFRFGIINYLVFQHLFVALFMMALRQGAFVRGIVIYSLWLLNAINQHLFIGDQRKLQIDLRLEKEIVYSVIVLVRHLLLFLVPQRL